MTACAQLIAACGSPGPGHIAFFAHVRAVSLASRGVSGSWAHLYCGRRTVRERRAALGLMVGEKKAISRGVFRYNGPCGCQDGHCAVRKSVIYIYSIYISAPPSNRPLEHLFVVQPSYARPSHAHVRIGVWYHPHGACRGFWLSIFGTRLFWPSLQCAPKPMKLVHRCHLRGWFRG